LISRHALVEAGARANRAPRAVRPRWRRAGSDVLFSGIRCPGPRIRLDSHHRRTCFVRRLVALAFAASLVVLACHTTTAPSTSPYAGRWAVLAFTSDSGCGGFCGGFNHVPVLGNGSFRPGGNDLLYNVVGVIASTGQIRGSVIWDNPPTYTRDSLVGSCSSINSCAGSVVGGFPVSGASVTFSMMRTLIVAQ
jgi:hypothetical protein